MQRHPNSVSHMTADLAVDLLKEWLSVAESGICSIEVLNEQLPVVNELLENSMNGLNDDFRKLTSEAYEQEKHIDMLLSHAENADEDFANALKEMKKGATDIKDSIGRVVVGMQFQDRVSQNLVITMDVLRAIVQYLRQAIEHSSTQLAMDDTKARIDAEFARKLIEQLKLGELQSRYANHLLEHGYIKDTAEVGYKMDDHYNNGNDVELF